MLNWDLILFKTLVWIGIPSCSLFNLVCFFYFQLFYLVFWALDSFYLSMKFLFSFSKKNWKEEFLTLGSGCDAGSVKNRKFAWESKWLWMSFNVDKMLFRLKEDSLQRKDRVPRSLFVKMRELRSNQIIHKISPMDFNQRTFFSFLMRCTLNKWDRLPLA